MIPSFMDAIDKMSDHEVNLEWTGFSDGTLQKIMAVFNGAGSEEARESFGEYIAEIRERYFNGDLSKDDLHKAHYEVKAKLAELCGEEQNLQLN